MKKSQSLIKLSVFELLSIFGLLSVLVTACGGGDTGVRAEEDGLERVLAISDSSERRKELLEWNLDHGCGDAAAIYLARERIAEGRLQEAELLLNASRDLSVGLEIRRLGDYLEGYLAFLRGDYGRAEDFLDRFATSIDKPGEADDLKDRAELLLARSMVALGKKMGKDRVENWEKAANLLLSLRERHSPYLNEEVQLELTALLLELGRREEAGELIGAALRNLSYNPQTARVWEGLAGEAGLAILGEITKLERKLIGGLPCDVETEGTRVSPVLKICSSIKAEKWSEVEDLSRSMKNAESHRLIAFLAALSSLRGQGADDQALESFLEAFFKAGIPYRNSQFYYYQLWKSIDGRGEKYEALLVETLKACITTGPSTFRALEARRRLAVSYDSAGLSGPLPMTEAEMKKLSDFVLQGAPVEILRPMLEFLEWPDSPCTLQAELILRGVRDIPEVRDFMTEFLNSAGPRAEERVRSILRF